MYQDDNNIPAFFFQIVELHTEGHRTDARSEAVHNTFDIGVDIDEIRHNDIEYHTHIY